MANLIFFNGVYTLSVVASLPNINSNNSNNILVAYLKNQRGSAYANVNYANLIKHSKCLSWFYFKQTFGFKQNKFTQYVNNCSNIYLPINSSTVKIYTVLKKIYPLANFIFYEEGLFSYIKPVFNKQLNRLLNIYTSYYIGYNVLNKYLNYYLGKAKINIINKQNLLSVFNKNTATININPSVNKKYCLMLPQYYYQNNKIKFNKLAKLYASKINQLQRNNYVVIFKQHPKAKVNLLNYIAKYTNITNVVVINNPVAAESIRFNVPISSIFSVYSTSLLSINYLYNIPAFSCLKMLKLRENLWSFYPTLTALLIKYNINYINCVTIDTNRDVSKIFKTKNILFNFFVKMFIVTKSVKEN